ncbi:MAG: hypothetical protein Q8S73_43080 [Deltaproteobacteria bacterium]|nr:hypothetical protein [Myxococcales bacterium]MDP3220947.1 hypothetical protein [Deltaproteobacteria bacterium]
MTNLGPPGHWKLLPQLDHRHGVPQRDRGVLFPGHTRGLPCPGCASGRQTPTVAPPSGPTARETLAPQSPPAAELPPAQRPTVPVRGDRAMPPTLRPVAAAPQPAPPWAPVAAPATAAAAPARVTSPEGPTVRARIVLALASMGPGPHDVNALVVAAWKRFPESFGLRGYESTYPDSGRVLSKLAGSDGVCGTGFCARVDGGRIRLTPYGAMRARQMEAEHGGR